MSPSSSRWTLTRGKQKVCSRETQCQAINPLFAHTCKQHLHWRLRIRGCPSNASFLFFCLYSGVYGTKQRRPKWLDEVKFPTRNDAWCTTHEQQHVDIAASRTKTSQHPINSLLFDHSRPYHVPLRLLVLFLCCVRIGAVPIGNSPRSSSSSCYGRRMIASFVNPLPRQGWVGEQAPTRPPSSAVQDIAA